MVRRERGGCFRSGVRCDGVDRRGGKALKKPLLWSLQHKAKLKTLSPSPSISLSLSFSFAFTIKLHHSGLLPFLPYDSFLSHHVSSTTWQLPFAIVLRYWKISIVHKIYSLSFSLRTSRDFSCNFDQFDRLYVPSGQAHFISLKTSHDRCCNAYVLSLWVEDREKDQEREKEREIFLIDWLVYYALARLCGK